MCVSFDLSAIERTRQIKLLLIRVFVDCFYIEISLKQNAPKQVKRFDYLLLVFFFPSCLLWRRCASKGQLFKNTYMLCTQMHICKEKKNQQIDISVCRSEAARDGVLVHLSDTWIGENATHILRFHCFFEHLKYLFIHSMKNLQLIQLGGIFFVCLYLLSLFLQTFILSLISNSVCEAQWMAAFNRKCWIYRIHT